MMMMYSKLFEEEDFLLLFSDVGAAVGRGDGFEEGAGDVVGEAVEPVDIGIRLHPRAVEHDRHIGLEQFGWVAEVHDVG